MKKVLLISANMMKLPYPVYPLGLDYVAGALHPYFETKVADMNELSSLDKLGELVRSFVPDYVGVSIRNIDNTDTLHSRGFLNDYQDLVGLVRKNSQAVLVLGGSGFTIFPAEFMRELSADYGIAGEGERLLLLLKALENKADISVIPGILTRHSNNFTHRAWYGATSRKYDPASPHTQFYLSTAACSTFKPREAVPSIAVIVLILILRAAR
jgi:hypothetical protein